MHKSLYALIVDDNPLIVHNLKNILNIINSESQDRTIFCRSANDYSSALYEIKKANALKPIDFLFLDLGISSKNDKELTLGENLGLLAKKRFPDLKSVVFTSYRDNFRLNKIFRMLNPEGFIVKSDMDFQQLLEGIKTVINDPPFYSKTVIKLLRRNYAHDLVLDDIDRKLLYGLSQGIRMKDLPDIIPMSIAGLERRKRKLKELFNVKQRNDGELLNQARIKGII